MGEAVRGSHGLSGARVGIMEDQVQGSKIEDLSLPSGERDRRLHTGTHRS